MTQYSRLRKLTPEKLAWLLESLTNKPMTSQMIRDCLADGAPQNPDGTLDFVPFVGWLLNEIDRRDD
jgi:hypothetical protein